jgi:arsenate reductase (thioredoxin)
MKTIVLLALSFCIASVANGQTKTIVFVCEHGAAKSVIAAEYFNRLAKERGLEWQAVCCATFPDSTLSAGTRSGLKSDKIRPNSNPKKFTMLDTAGVERIILFTALPADYKTSIPVENWSSIQNIDAAYPLRRDAIIQQLNNLLDNLENK